MSTIAMTDPKIAYSPYTWKVTGAGAKTICAGAYLSVFFTGNPSALAVTFDVTNQPAAVSRVGIRVDGGPWQDSAVAASVPVTMPSGVTYGSHLVEVVVIATTESAPRWAAPQNTAVIITGITADVTVTTRDVRKYPLRALLFGDSITEGVRGLQMNAATDVLRNDSRTAWAYPLRAALGAEVGVVGFGATGITRTGSGGVPKFPDSLPYLWDTEARDLTTDPPDVVIGHIGSNDLSSSDATVTADTITLCNWLLANTLSTCPILILPGWVQRKASAIEAGVAGCADPARVSYIDTTGWWNTADASDSLHPYGYINLADLSPRLADLARAAIGSRGPSGQYICGPDGTPIPI
ncbi:hypothetical protein J2Y69_002144 [Microbacterium resistens]|uniref:SGNH hydrolase-type esterase domain-containing protein n=1 Tax=Microbacterium resistens TaxID=156977 RepID=A0ABU1SD66_9MICO|nr:SGNH/GDSL hydrolase family protein [Microbacterium resistens]MDR6867540.1 hypothetical protein [Microbacterium resistens]